MIAPNAAKDPIEEATESKTESKQPEERVETKEISPLELAKVSRRASDLRHPEQRVHCRRRC